MFEERKNLFVPIVILGIFVIACVFFSSIIGEQNKQLELQEKRLLELDQNKQKEANLQQEKDNNALNQQMGYWKAFWDVKQAGFGSVNIPFGNEFIKITLYDENYLINKFEEQKKVSN